MQKKRIPEPEKGLKFIDVHCHLPFPRPKNDRLPSDEDQYLNYFKIGGLYLITCSIDMETLMLIRNFIKNKNNIGFTCGWAPQTVTYTPKDHYNKEWKKWIDYTINNSDQYLAIGEIGLDFHHAKTLDKRNKQVEELKKMSKEITTKEEMAQVATISAESKEIGNLINLQILNLVSNELKEIHKEIENLINLQELYLYDNELKEIHKELKKIFKLTKDLDKPYVLHVRNAARNEIDNINPNHEYNKEDGATLEILKILKEYKIDPKEVMWHCFSGPEEYGTILPEQGFTLSVPSSAYSFNRWQKVTKKSPLSSLVTETDSYYQHPYQRGPVNVPSNARYAVAAIAHTHTLPQESVSEKTVENARIFFNLDIS